MTRPFSDLPKLARRAQVAIGGAAPVAVRRHTTVVGLAARASVKAAVPDGVMSGVGTKGARVGVRIFYSAVPRPRGMVAGTGPLHLLEFDTKGHVIVPKRRKALKVGDGFAGKVNHPGTRGQHVFARGVKAAEPAARRQGIAAAVEHVARNLR